MEYKIAFFITTLILSALLIFNLKYTLSLLRKWQVLRRAKPLTGSLEVGDYVQVQGHVQMPATKSPLLDKPCVYWKSYVWASFESKRKKPGKGMQEHSPLLEAKKCEVPPVVVAQSGVLAHVDFSRFSSVMLNLTRYEDRQNEPPNEATAKLAKDKYRAYRIHEYVLPVNANVAVWGKVHSVNKNLVSIVGANSDQYPSFLYYGDGKDIDRKLFSRMGYCWSIMILCCLIFAGFDKLSEFGFLAVMVCAGVLLYLQKLSKKKLFSLK